MKTVQELKNRKVPIVAIDAALDKYRDKIMFPSKLKKANKMLNTAKLPTNRHSHLHGTTCSSKEESNAKE